MKMRCPHCQVKGTATETLRGRIVRCPQCLQLFRVPETGIDSIKQETAASSRHEEPRAVVAQGAASVASGSDPADELDERPAAVGEAEVVERSTIERDPLAEHTMVAEAPLVDPVPQETDQIEQRTAVAALQPDHAETFSDDSGMNEETPTEDPGFPDLSAQSIAWEEAESPLDTQQVPVPDETVDPEDFRNVTTEQVATEGEIAGDLNALLAESCVACGKPLPRPGAENDEDGGLCHECRRSGPFGSHVGIAAEGNGVSHVSLAGVPAAGPELMTDGGKSFTVTQILKTSWSTLKGSKGVIWTGVVLMILSLVGVEALTLYALPQAAAIGGSAAASWTTIVSQVIGSLLTLIFMAGLMVVGVRQVSGSDYSWKTVLAGFAFPGRIAIAGFLMVLLIVSGFVLLILPGIYLSVGYSLTLPLMVERGYGPWQAMEASRQMIHPRWWQVFGAYLVMYLLYLVSCIPLGIGLIWTVPMFFVLTGVIYQLLTNRADLS